MKKETTVAILFGIFFGAIIAIFLIIRNKAAQLQTAKTIAPDIKTKSKLNPNQLNGSLLEITFPTNGMIVSKNIIVIKGKINYKSLILIQSPAHDVVKTEDKGDFSLNFELAPGENIIRVSAYSKDPQSRSQEKELKVYYLDEL